MRVRVKLFATLARFVPDTAPAATFDVELPAGATVAELIRHLKLPEHEVKLIFVDGRARTADWVLQPDEQVGIFPPVGGG